MRRELLLCPVIVALTGCVVSKDTYMKKEEELAACVGERDEARRGGEECRRALEARTAEAEARGREVEAVRLKELDNQRALEACQGERASLAQRAAAAEARGAQAAAAGAEAKTSADADLGRARQEAESSRAAADTARADAARLTQEVEALKAREAELRARLEQEIRDRTVEVDRLKARLSVRVVDRILFDTGKAEIRREGKAVLDKVADVIGGTAERVRVEGHTDDIPVSRRLKDKFYSNWELSAARAANVVRYLQYGRGVDPARMEAVGLGPYRPDAPNDSFEGRAQNRRVVIVLTPAAEPAATAP